ncbi:hypothetical protein LEMLEM_LOCUS7197, partial [Lemmus lemmus]
MLSENEHLEDHSLETMLSTVKLLLRRGVTSGALMDTRSGMSG